jgi:dipeptidyl aminopeptidase/acylaminoacyl peptidase
LSPELRNARPNRLATELTGREVELITYPEEHHEMKSTGRPDRRIDRMERILAWFDRWVREKEG